MALDRSEALDPLSGTLIRCLGPTYMDGNLREFVRTAVILIPAREASRVGTAFRREDPEECSFLLEFETPVELERLAISNERPLSNLSVSTFKNIKLLFTFSSRCPKR